MENMEWVRRGNTYFGNGLLTVAEYVFGFTMMLNDEQVVGSMVTLGNPDVVVAMGVSQCERLY